MTDDELMALPQGDLRLLETSAAQALLRSNIPARFAYTASDGTPRIVATWFDWDGSDLHMPTFLDAPHVQHPARRIEVLRSRPHAAVSIDTESFPSSVLSLRGAVRIVEVHGVAPQYARAADRYLGEGASDYLAALRTPTTRMADIVFTPTWVGLLDFQRRNPGGLGGVHS